MGRDTSLHFELKHDITGWYESATSRIELYRGFNQFQSFVKIEGEKNQYSFNFNNNGPRKLIPASANSLISKGHTAYLFVFASDDEGNEYLHLPYQELNYIKVSGFKIWSKKLLLIISTVIICTALIEIFILLFIALIRKKKLKNILARVLPLITILVGIIWVVFNFLYFAPTHDFTIIGRISFESITFFILSLLFAISSIIAFAYNIFSFRFEMNKLARIHSLMISLFCISMTIYLFYWDFIGLRTWIY